jgi:chitinase
MFVEQRTSIRSLAVLCALVWAIPQAGAGKPQYNLTTSATCDGVEGDCGYVEPFGGIFSRNNFIEVTATPQYGWEFDRWQSDLSGNANPTNYRFDDSNYNVHFTAVFVTDTTPGGPDDPPPPPPPPPPEEAVDFRVIAYFPEWGVYQQPYYVRSMIDGGAADKITHLNYAFGVPAPDPVTGEITCQLDDPAAAYQQTYSGDDGNGNNDSVDGVGDVPGQLLRGHFNQLKKLKDAYPDIKILVSLGGWLGSAFFSDAALSAQSRATFVSSCIDLFIRGDLPIPAGEGAAAGIFDGIDIDWEYPVAGGASGTHHNKDDAANLSLLFQEFRSQFDQQGLVDSDGDELLLTMAGPASDYRGQNYNIGQDQAILDYVQIMTYDFHGSWEHKTGHLTNPCTSILDPASETWRLSLDKSVKLYRDQYGVPSAKIVPGAAFYGRGWKRAKEGGNDGLYGRAGGAASGTYEDGYDYYQDLPWTDPSFQEHWDDLAKAAWLYSPTKQIFWTYDNPESLAVKADYVRFFNLGGLMFWEVSGDLGGTLIDALHHGLKVADAPTSNPCQ